MEKRSETARADAVEWASNFIAKPRLNDILRQPTAIFHRFQFRVTSDGAITKKIRQVWALPYRTLVLQAFLFRRLVDFCVAFVNANGNVVTPWGLKGNPEISSTIIRKFRLMSAQYQKDLVSLDVASFDSSVPSFMYALFLTHIKRVVPDYLHDVVDKLMAYECFTPYVKRTGQLLFQKTGIPSGSLFTQLFGTFVTRTVINYAFLERTRGKHGAGEFSNCLGDDNLILLEHVTYAHILDVYRRFGLEIEVSKTKLVKPGEIISYLGPLWDSENRPTQPLNWYIARFACPSRYFVRPAFTVPYFQTYRCVSTVMPYYRGLSYFERLVGYGDRVYQELLRMLSRGEDVLIPITDVTGKTVTQTVPLARLKEKDWLAFADKVTNAFRLDLGAPAS